MTIAPSPKKSVGLRLTEATAKELESLAKKYNVSQAGVVAVLVHCVFLHGAADAEKLEEIFEIVSRC